MKEQRPFPLVSGACRRRRRCRRLFRPGRMAATCVNASLQETEAAICKAWPGVRDAERRRTRGARILLQHLDGFPGQDLAAALGAPAG